MDDLKAVFYVKLPMTGFIADDLNAGRGYCTVARCASPESAGEIIRVLCTATMPETDHIRVEIRREL